MPSPEDGLVQGAVDQVTLHGSLDSIQLMGGQFDMLDVLMDRDREGHLW